MKKVVGSNVQTKPELSEFSEIIGGALFSTSSQLSRLFGTEQIVWKPGEKVHIALTSRLDFYWPVGFLTKLYNLFLKL